MKSIIEQMDLEYIEVDGLLYPNIQLDDVEAYINLGKYGNLRLKYLHEKKPNCTGNCCSLASWHSIVPR